MSGMEVVLHIQINRYNRGKDIHLKIRIFGTLLKNQTLTFTFFSASRFLSTFHHSSYFLHAIYLVWFSVKLDWLFYRFYNKFTYSLIQLLSVLSCFFEEELLKRKSTLSFLLQLRKCFLTQRFSNFLFFF